MEGVTGEIGSFQGYKKQHPIYKNKNDFHKIGATYCIKDYKEWKTTLGIIQKTNELKVRNKPKRDSNIARSLDEKQGENANQEKEILKTKLE